MKIRTIRSARWWAVFLVGALIAALIAVPVSADSHDPFTLTILHNNDGESALLPSGDEAGVARFATALKRAKRTALNQGDGFIMVSSGDNFLASPEFAASLADGVFYDALALDMLRYDAHGVLLTFAFLALIPFPLILIMGIMVLIIWHYHKRDIVAGERQTR